MTDEQKYNELLKELAQLIKDKNDAITWQQMQIDILQEKLAAAEKQIETMKGPKTNGTEIQHNN